MQSTTGRVCDIAFLWALQAVGSGIDSQNRSYRYDDGKLFVAQALGFPIFPDMGRDAKTGGNSEGMGRDDDDEALHPGRHTDSFCGDCSWSVPYKL